MGGTQATVATSTVAVLGGLGLGLDGLWRDQPSQSIAGIAVIMVALTAIILAVLHHWITDTSSERAALAAATCATQVEKDRYVTLQAAIENEHQRLMQDVAAERAALDARLLVERAAMEEQLEMAVTEASNEAMRILHSWMRGGKLSPPTPQQATVLRFPAQDQPEPVRARERGGVGP
ncbi:hypothetical protein [Streptomyces sp. NBC_01373]|uniref:hypothetical protein n=1 Tax=Streptomyces sp. NBC_01373 TaxID=2903843 RepID=UPI0022521B51|nr:hypothetical protein [Streptomyces sp. NBC_01373]MCX4703936.1 hypothetical protein [Streptomyces sp. NBC_01373]